MAKDRLPVALGKLGRQVARWWTASALDLLDDRCQLALHGHASDVGKHLQPGLVVRDPEERCDVGGDRRCQLVLVDRQRRLCKAVCQALGKGFRVVDRCDPGKISRVALLPADRQALHQGQHVLRGFNAHPIHHLGSIHEPAL
ncbi:MAG: hypothetical protein EBZ51_13170, partial [Synechococcaceae bacterium WB9_2_112]|nr:hypothetical protein [Synechococcaceae bacterium WB9_2_112]